MLTSDTCDISNLDSEKSKSDKMSTWNASHKNFINTRYFYPPYNSTEHDFSFSEGGNGP